MAIETVVFGMTWQKYLGSKGTKWFVPRSGQSLYDIAIEHAFDYQKYGLTLDPAVMSKIHFNAKKVLARPKAYVFCTQGEFFDLIKPMYEKIKAANDDWLRFSLDAPHACMVTHFKELAVILFGMQLQDL